MVRDAPCGAPHHEETDIIFHSCWDCGRVAPKTSAPHDNDGLTHRSGYNRNLTLKRGNAAVVQTSQGCASNGRERRAMQIQKQLQSEHRDVASSATRTTVERLLAGIREMAPAISARAAEIEADAACRSIWWRR